MHLSIWLSMHLCIYLSDYQCIYASIYLTINASMHLSIWLSIYAVYSHICIPTFFSLWEYAAAGAYGRHPDIMSLMLFQVCSLLLNPCIYQTMYQCWTFIDLTYGGHQKNLDLFNCLVVWLFLKSAPWCIRQLQRKFKLTSQISTPIKFSVKIWIF